MSEWVRGLGSCAFFFMFFFIQDGWKSLEMPESFYSILFHA